MKKVIKQVYLILISALLFGCFLAVQKGFDLLNVLSTDVGKVILFSLFIGTIIEMFPTNNNKNKKEKLKTSEKIQFNNFEIDKKLIENHLTEITKDTNENLSVSFSLNGKVITTNVRLIKIDNMKVNEVVEELKVKIETNLQETFGLKEELTLKFNIE